MDQVYPGAYVHRADGVARSVLRILQIPFGDRRAIYERGTKPFGLLVWLA
jgi:hypothetical protein